MPELRILFRARVMARHRPAIAAAALALVTACATSPSHQAALVQEVDQAAVAGCRFLGEARGMSGWGGSAAAGTGANNARVSAKEKAAKLGATHLVWVARGDVIQTAVAHAYECTP
jgi:hypothetical protein